MVYQRLKRLTRCLCDTGVMPPCDAWQNPYRSWCRVMRTLRQGDVFASAIHRAWPQTIKSGWNTETTLLFPNEDYGGRDMSFGKNIHLISAIGLLLSVSACQATNVSQYAEIDSSNKTVTMPAGNRGLLGRLKNGLSERGWKFTFDRGPDRVTGTNKDSVDLESYNTFNTRYRMIVDWNQFDICINLQPAIYYDIVLIDNQTGSEVVALSGRECEAQAAREFFSVLDDD